MKRHRLSAVAAALLLAAPIPAAARAAVPCADHEAVSEELRRSYGETVQSMGLAENGNLMEIYASGKGTWSIVVTAPGGPACLVSSGEGFVAMEEETLIRSQKDTF